MDPTSYRISEKAVARVAEVAIRTVPGTRAVDAKLAGLAGRSFPRVDAHIDRPAGAVALDIEIITTYPAPVGVITDEVRQTVGTHVETLTGLAVNRVSISVADAEASAAGQRVTRGDIARHPVGIRPQPVHIAPSKVTSPVVKTPDQLADITVDSSTYDNVRHVDVPEAPRLASVELPAPPSVDHVSPPVPVKLIPVSTPEPVRPVSVTAPTPAVPLPVATPEPTALTPISVARRTQPISVQVPEQAPLREITIASGASRARLAPVSLPPRRPLEQITAPRPAFVPVDRPMPQPLRRITVEPLTVVSPDAPSQQPLDVITIDPDRVDEDSYTETTASRKEGR